jgi:hypothetical protein
MYNIFFFFTFLFNSFLLSEYGYALSLYGKSKQASKPSKHIHIYIIQYSTSYCGTYCVLWSRLLNKARETPTLYQLYICACFTLHCKYKRKKIYIYRQTFF